MLEILDIEISYNIILSTVLYFSGLPSVCQMLPPATGKCCSKQSCLLYVQLQFPAGYVEHCINCFLFIVDV